MKDEKGISIISLVITIILLMMIATISINAGVVTVRNAKFNKAKSEMEILQSNVNYWNQEYNQLADDKKTAYIDGIGVATDDSTCNQTTLTKTATALNISASNYRFLSKNFLKQKLGLEDSNEFLVDIIDRRVILFKGILYEGKYYYTIEDFGIEIIDTDRPNSISFNLTQGDNNDIIISDVKLKDNNNKMTEISKFNVKYKKVIDTLWTDATADIKKFKDEDNKIKYKFSVSDASVYEVSVATTADNSIGQTKRLKFAIRANAPKLKDGMIPIKYANNKWVVADKTNKNNDWYNYDERKWANICTVASSNESLRSATVGTEIPLNKMTTMFVWIPRYAYSIIDGYQTTNTENVWTTNANMDNGNYKIDVKFLVGNTNSDAEGQTYSLDYNPESDIMIKNNKKTTPMIVHPAFTFKDNQIEGFWMAKFEASGTKVVSGVEYPVGNGTSSSNSAQYTADGTTFVKSLPGVISWRYITIGESQYRCRQMSTNTTAYGWNNVDSHLIKNSEWGAVAYLCYSKYGRVPMINGCGNYTGSYYYDIYTGMGPNSATSESKYDATNENMSTRAYSSTIGMYASTTGNVTGVYDMSGGSWERVATYLDNRDGNLSYYGNYPRTNPIERYFTAYNEINTEYSAYWEGYEVSAEERNDQIEVEGELNKLTKSELWNKYNHSTITGFDNASVNLPYNKARKRLTDATFNLLAKIKGIGVNEFSGVLSNGVLTKTHSYYGVNSSGSYVWLMNDTDTAASSTNTYGKAWNNDYVFIGHASIPFVVRGGGVDGGAGAGVLYSSFAFGGAYSAYGFRAVLCP